MNNKKNKGYSLIEIIVYLAIFSTLSILVMNSFLVTLKSFNVSRVNSNLSESAANSLERLSREIRQADSIDVVNSVLNSSSGVLQLNSTDEDGLLKVVRFSISDGDLNIYENGVLLDNLLGQKIEVTNFELRRIVSTEGEAVRIQLTLQNIGSSVSSENFYNTVILRGSY